MSCPALSYSHQPLEQPSNVLRLFPRNKLRFENFAIAIVPSRRRHRVSRRPTTSWQLVPLRTLKMNGVRVEKIAKYFVILWNFNV